MSPAKGCYCCRAAGVPRHDEYPQLCTTCGEENLARRTIDDDLAGVVALVTGARVKIGRHTALRLLRRGATVVATTRFPRSAAESFAAEPDYGAWADRLLVRGLDLVRVDLIGEFVDQLAREIGHLDILINNAAQTVVDASAQWAQWEHEALLGRELPTGPGSPPPSLAGPWSVPPVTTTIEGAKAAGAPALAANTATSTPAREPSADAGVALAAGAARERARAAGEPTAVRDPAAEPTAVRDPAVPARAANDWVKLSADVSLADLLTVQIVNVTAPYLLTIATRDLLAASPHRNRFVVNVSSLEGKFSVRKKSSAHPHTNMAKAALNMMTKTLAAEYRRDRIFTYSIDPGWVSHQFPTGRPSTTDPLPLGLDDAAARLTQPLDDWRDVERPPTGVFLKDYRETPW